jgi:predicted ribosomally synthesized peptide with SipW-like signal peptide
MAENDRQKRGRKLLLTLLIVGVVGSIAGIGTFSAFSSTTANSNNSFAAGTVYITDNDGGSAMFGVSNAKPGSVSKCITVTYLGSLDANVHLYGSGFGGALAPYLNLKVEQGTSSSAFGSCATFSATSTLYNSGISGFATTYGTGYDTEPGAGRWATNDAISYRFTVTLADDNNANGGSSPLASNNFSFTWEAQNV